MCLVLGIVLGTAFIFKPDENLWLPASLSSAFNFFGVLARAGLVVHVVTFISAVAAVHGVHCTDTTGPQQII